MKSDGPALPDRVLVIAGPTASGKTELAAELARRFDAEIVSADSRQVYRHMDVGTAKPCAELLAEIRHHMIEVVDPDEPFDTATWCEGARAALADLHARGRNAIVCGGTGLYVRSLVQGLFVGPAADAGLRARYEAEDRVEPGVLMRRLARVDPPAAARIHPNDRVRIVRALEVHELTGRPISSWHDEHRLAQRPFREVSVMLDLARDELYRRIDARTESMVHGGLVDELRRLRNRGYAADLRAFDAIGYREAGLCLDGRLAAEDLVSAIARSTRRYAKRQLVWLRGQARCRPVAPHDIEREARVAAELFEGRS
ncbi:MAG: tRNA (adenosine(37)-N6)-dimethylallyltransferase MiaA [Myxococcales bacterium]|nr:MAG: tRNA (adenosine(37)-N6)-dimethylallyltransferase MiaA [Myxococcales bacterium]